MRMDIYKDARLAYKALQGLFCVYKPAGVPLKQVKHAILTNLCKELNGLPGRPQEQFIEISGVTNAPMEVNVRPNYADDPHVVGPRYQIDDFRCNYCTHLGLFTSGVLLFGIQDGVKTAFKLHTARPTRAYKLTGRLGKATDTFYMNGKVVELATYKHVTREKIDKITAYMQSAHQKKMFEISGVHMESQTAYELASRGLVRPANNNTPVVYGIKCTHFESPYFTIEIQSVNEYENYLCTLIHDLGIQLKTVAHCTALQCIREGKFDVNVALLRKHWKLKDIIENIQLCDHIVRDSESLINHESALLQ